MIILGKWDEFPTQDRFRSPDPWCHTSTERIWTGIPLTWDFLGRLGLGSQAGSKISLERVRRGSSFRDLWWPGYGAGKRVPKRGHGQGVAWFEFLTKVKAEKECPDYLNSLPRFGVAGGRDMGGLENCPQTSKWSQTSLHMWSRCSYKDCSWIL